MGEYLELLTDTLTDDEIKRLLARELAGQPDLLDGLHVAKRSITTKLATCNDVFFTFDALTSLYWFRRRHDDAFRYGPSHAYNATLEAILRDPTSLYLGPWEGRNKRGKPARVPATIATEVDHYPVWRTETGNRAGHNRTVRPDDTTAASGASNRVECPCPNSRRTTFTAYEAGYAWNWETNQGRTLYRCRPCGRLFNMGAYDTPEYAGLAEALRTTTEKRLDQHEEQSRGRPQPPPVG